MSLLSEVHSEALLFAFSVSAAGVEASVICFADSRTAAKQLARVTDWMRECDWTDFRVRREPTLDAMASERGPGCLDGSGPEDAQVMRALGWYEVDNLSSTCEECGLHQWECLPESYISEVDDHLLCRRCQEQIPTTSSLSA